MQCCSNIYFSVLYLVLQQLHIEDIKFSYQSLVCATVMQRMNGIISRFFPGHFTSRKWIFLSHFFTLCKHMSIAPQYMYCLHTILTDVKIICTVYEEQSFL